MSNLKQKLGVCPECKVRDGDSSEKTLYKCNHCERWFCFKHYDPKLAVFKDFERVVKDKKLRRMIEEDWRRKDGHPDHAYSLERLREYDIEKEMDRKLMSNLMDRSKAYGKRKAKPAKVPRKRIREGEFFFVKEDAYTPPETSVSRKMKVSLPKELIIFIVFIAALAFQYAFVETYFAVTAYIFVVFVAGYVLYKLFLLSSRIRVHSDLRLFGLRILAGVTFLVGILLTVGAFMSYAVAYQYWNKPVFMSVLLFFGVFGLGLILLASYLMFRFMLKSGVIVYRR